MPIEPQPKKPSQSKKPQEAKPPNFPWLLKHMTVAIAKNMGLASAGGFEKAFKIARGRLTDYKHLVSEAKSADLFDEGAVRLTGTGRRLESEHKREPGAKGKAQLFDWYWKKWIKPPPQSAKDKKDGA